MAKKHSHNYIHISKSDLQSYYSVQKLTLKDIAEIYDCSISAIHTHMVEYYIPRRSISESKRGISVKHSGQFKKGLEPWNKDTQGYSTSKKGMKMSKEVCKKMSKTSHMKGKCIEAVHKANCQCPVCKMKRGEIFGENHPGWKGGKQLSQLRSSVKRRKLGDNKLFENPFADSVEIEWHHPNDNDIVALPKDLHTLYKGYRRQDHRELVLNIVNQVYYGGEIL